MLTILPSMLIALFLLIGISYNLTGSIELISSFSVGFFLMWILFVVMTVLLNYLIKKLYGLFDKMPESSKLSGYRIRKLTWCYEFYEKHPYLSVYLLYLIVDLPYMIATYPALFWGDTPAQVMQGYNLKDETASYLKLLDENVFLNQHHPVPHTLILHACIALGKNVFGSYNFGAFIFAFLQFTFITLVVAYAANYLYKKNVPSLLILIMLVYYLLHPKIQNHMFLITKDIIYGGFFILVLITLFDILSQRDKKASAAQIIKLFLFGLGFFLFRNEGNVVLSVVLVVAIIFSKKHRVALGGVLVALTCVLLFLSNVVYPAFNISPGSRREKLCLPFQQTAYYLNQFPDEVTDKEREAISKVLDYDHMLQCYDWNRADPAKATFNEYCTNEELTDYFVTWFEMFLKHPRTYFDATLHQTLGYYYPPAGYLWRVPYHDSSWLMAHTNKKAEAIGADFVHPEALAGYRSLYEKGFEFIARFTPCILLSLSATYLWFLIIIFFYFIRKKKWSAMIVSILLLLQYSVCFAGPFDGTCFRYIYPMAMSLIPLFYLGVFCEKEVGSDEVVACRKD